MNISDIRTEYNRQPLDKSGLSENPIPQFEAWLQAAIESEVNEPTAMALATVIEGKPSLRIVLLKGIGAEGFTFFTNYESRKAEQLAQNPHAALTFFWPELHRQIRIEGTVSQASAEVSDTYFQSRSKGSRIGAWASPQSKVLQNREELETRVKETEQKFADKDTFPRPPFWGGYTVNPTRVEFWQGRPSRLHDRFVYLLGEKGNWKIERLAP